MPDKLTPQERAMIDRAISEGKYKIMPTATYSSQLTVSEQSQEKSEFKVSKNSSSLCKYNQAKTFRRNLNKDKAIDLFLKGFSTEEIAVELDLSYSIVSLYVRETRRGLLKQKRKEDRK